MPYHTLQRDCCTFQLDVRSASSLVLVFLSLTALQLSVAGGFVHSMCALYLVQQMHP